MFLLSSSSCPVCPSALFFLSERSLQDWLLNRFFIQPLFLHPVQGTSYLPLFCLIQPLPSSLSEISRFELLAGFMTPIFFATKAHALGIMIPTHQVQSETTAKDFCCPACLPFKPVCFPTVSADGSKEASAAGALRLLHVDILGAGRLPLLQHAAPPEVPFQSRVVCQEG